MFFSCNGHTGSHFNTEKLCLTETKLGIVSSWSAEWNFNFDPSEEFSYQEHGHHHELYRFVDCIQHRSILNLLSPALLLRDFRQQDKIGSIGIKDFLV